MKRLISLASLVIVILLSLSAVADAKDLKIAYVSIDKIMADSEAAKAVKAELDEKVDIIKKNLAVKEAEIKALVEAYRDQKSVMKNEVRLEKEQELTKKDMEYKQLVQVAERGISEDLKKHDIKMLDDIKLIVEKIGKKKGYDIVFDELTLEKGLDTLVAVATSVIKKRSAESFPGKESYNLSGRN